MQFAIVLISTTTHRRKTVIREDVGDGLLATALAVVADEHAAGRTMWELYDGSLAESEEGEEGAEKPTETENG